VRDDPKTDHSLLSVLDLYLPTVAGAKLNVNVTVGEDLDVFDLSVKRLLRWGLNPDHLIASERESAHLSVVPGRILLAQRSKLGFPPVAVERRALVRRWSLDHLTVAQRKNLLLLSNLGHLVFVVEKKFLLGSSSNFAHVTRAEEKRFLFGWRSTFVLDTDPEEKRFLLGLRSNSGFDTLSKEKNFLCGNRPPASGLRDERELCEGIEL
jgi:hypothetical protein